MSVSPLPSKRLDLGVIIPQLEKYGGAERFLVECIRHWQHSHDITLYASRINHKILVEHGITDSVKTVELTPYFEGEHAMLLNCILLPKIWQREIGRHELYHTHLWSTHLLDLHPMVWFPHEPLRIMHDLKFEHTIEHFADQLKRNVHMYPKYNYDSISDNLYEAYLDAVEQAEKAAWPDVIVGNSKYTAAYLSRIYDREVKEVVYPGVDPSEYFSLPTDENIFVTISQLWPHKRVNLLIEAIKEVESVQLYIIGSGPDREKLESYVEELGLSDRVFFLSGLNNEDVKIVLARARGFLFAPVREPFGIVALEAMAAGKAIVAVNEGGFTEALTEEAAFLVAPTVSAFAEKIAWLRDHPKEAESMGRRAKELVGNFTWKRTADELLEILLKTHQVSVEESKKREPTGIHAPERTLFGVQYYLWYQEGYRNAHWDDNRALGGITDRPLIGYYSSSKGSVIEWHLQELENAGIDFAVLNLHVEADGPNTYELTCIQHMFEVAARTKSKLRFAIQLCPVNCSVEKLELVVSMVKKIFVPRNEYLRVDGKPVLLWFWTGSYDGDFRFFNRLKELVSDFAQIACSLRLPNLKSDSEAFRSFFDGFNLYSPLELGAKENWDTIWQKSAGLCEELGFPLRTATWCPGYDDAHLADPNRYGNPYRSVDRGDGWALEQTYQHSLQQDHPADLVLITSFNEFHENTHIEPSAKQGSFYLDRIRKMIRSYRENWSR